MSQSRKDEYLEQNTAALAEAAERLEKVNANIEFLKTQDFEYGSAMFNAMESLLIEQRILNRDIAAYGALNEMLASGADVGRAAPYGPQLRYSHEPDMGTFRRDFLLDKWKGGDTSAYTTPTEDEGLYTLTQQASDQASTQRGSIHTAVMDTERAVTVGAVDNSTKLDRIYESIERLHATLQQKDFNVSVEVPTSERYKCHSRHP